METYQIKLPQFEGPFDLLLFFIERDELDIYDIPIGRIAGDFLQYIRQMQELNMEVAGAFIVVAARLMQIKARMLLPRKEVDEEGNEIDPREELVERLLEYKLYKQVAPEIEQMATDRAARYNRGNVQQELDRLAEKVAVEAELESVSLYKLMQVFEQTLDRFHNRGEERHIVYRYPYDIQHQRKYLLETVRKHSSAPFEAIFQVCRDRLQAIFTFLALLELIHEKVLHIQLGHGINNFMVTSR